MPHATVSDALVAAAGTARGVRTIEHDGREMAFAYRQVLADALHGAAGLRRHGLAPGDHVAIVVPEVAGFIRAFFAISAAGMVPVPLAPPAHAGDIETFSRQSQHVLRAARASAVVVAADVAPLLDVGGLPKPIAVVTVDDLAADNHLEAPVRVAAASTALLQFTSGSTAAPKGVVLTHDNLRANVEAIVGPDGLGARPDDIGVSWLPLYHDMGLIGMLLAAVYAPTDTIIMSPVLFLKRPTAWLDVISSHHATVSFAPNFAYELCVRRVKPSQIASLDLSSWRAAGCGAEPIRAETLGAFADRFEPAGFRRSSFLPSYGLAEHALAVSFARGLQVDTVDADRLVRDSVAVPADDSTPRRVRIVCCGRAFPKHEIAIVDEQDRRLPERHVGAIIVRGPSVMRGYFGDCAATAETLRDGWLYTGDLGYVADASLYVCGRSKDLIIRQGRKYHPADLESAIADLKGIRPSGVVVFAITHLDEPDEVVAVLEARATVSSDDLEEQVRLRIRETAGLELDRILVTPPGTIPRTTSGKVRRSETRERFRAGTLLGCAGDGSSTLLNR